MTIIEEFERWKKEWESTPDAERYKVVAPERVKQCSELHFRLFGRIPENMEELEVFIKNDIPVLFGLLSKDFVQLTDENILI